MSFSLKRGVSVQQAVLDSHVFLFLGALWHLSRNNTLTVAFSLQSVVSEAELRLDTSLTMLEVVAAKRWALLNELIDDKGVGYAINELGQEYLRFKKPEYEPPSPPPVDHFPPVKRFKHRRR